MRDQIISNLAAVLPRSVVTDMFDAYERTVQKLHARDYESCLNRAGKFAEHVLRCLEYVRTGNLPAEIRSVAQTISSLRAAKDLNESVGKIIPGVLGSMIYEVRSKKGAVHVKEVDPGYMDATLAVTAASWVISELLRLYHTAQDTAVRMYVSSLMRSKLPFIETISDELVVTKKVPATIEIALLLSTEPATGLSRAKLGKSATCSPSSVTRGLGSLIADRWVHKTESGNYHLTGVGEKGLAEWLDAQPF